MQTNCELTPDVCMRNLKYDQLKRRRLNPECCLDFPSHHDMEHKIQLYCRHSYLEIPLLNLATTEDCERKG